MVYGAKFVNHANAAAGQSKAAKKISSTGIVVAISVGWRTLLSLMSGEHENGEHVWWCFRNPHSSLAAIRWAKYGRTNPLSLTSMSAALSNVERVEPKMVRDESMTDGCMQNNDRNKKPIFAFLECD